MEPTTINEIKERRSISQKDDIFGAYEFICGKLDDFILESFAKYYPQKLLKIHSHHLFERASHRGYRTFEFATHFECLKLLVNERFLESLIKLKSEVSPLLLLCKTWFMPVNIVDSKIDAIALLRTFYEVKKVYGKKTTQDFNKIELVYMQQLEKFSLYSIQSGINEFYRTQFYHWERDDLTQVDGFPDIVILKRQVERFDDKSLLFIANVNFIMSLNPEKMQNILLNND